MGSANDKPQITFERRRPVSVATVHVARMLDAFNVAEFGAQLTDYIKAHPGEHTLLNFEHVEYLSSAALTELLRARDVASKSGGTIRLWGVCPAILEVFKITNLDRVFTIYHTESVIQAVRKLKRSLEIDAEEKSWGRLSVDDD